MQYSDGRGWREQITPELLDMGVTVFNPYSKPFVSEAREDELTRKTLHDLMEQENLDIVAERMRLVRNYDLRLCDISDFLIAHIIPNVASWGSAEELTTCCRAKKPVFISIEGGRKRTPLWITAMFPPKYIYNNVQEIVDILKKINIGEKEIDNDKWKLLKEEYR